MRGTRSNAYINTDLSFVSNSIVLFISILP